MRVDDAYPDKSKYLKEEDLNHEDHVVTITAWRLAEFQGQDESKISVTFEPAINKKTELVLNKTNGKMVERVTGEADTDDWVGKRIIVGPDMTSFQGKPVPCVRVRATRPAASSAPPASPPPTVDPGNAAAPASYDQNGVWAWMASRGGEAMWKESIASVQETTGKAAADFTEGEWRSVVDYVSGQELPV